MVEHGLYSNSSIIMCYKYINSQALLLKHSTLGELIELIQLTNNYNIMCSTCLHDCNVRMALKLFNYIARTVTCLPAGVMNKMGVLSGP